MTLESPRVHPRWVWAGLAVAVLGLVVVGVGVSLVSTVWAVIGCVLLVAGCLAAVAGGVLYDAVPELEAGTEMHQVAAGQVHPGVAPGDQADDEQARRNAAIVTRTTERILEPVDHGPRELAPVAGGLLMLTAAALVILQGALATQTVTGHTLGVRDDCLAVLIGAAGFRILTMPGRHPVAAGLAGLAGCVLVVAAALTAHDRQAMTVIGVVGGGVALLAAATALTSPAEERSSGG